MTISALVTIHNEGSILKELIERLESSTVFLEIVILDDCSDDAATLEVLSQYPLSVHTHALNNDYGTHKTYGISLCKGDYVLQLDADELPTVELLNLLPELIDSNADTDLFYIPRLNDFVGVTRDNAAYWGWHLSMSDTLQRPVVNWHSGDYQGRLFKKDLPRIQFTGRLHERITGHETFAYLPKDESLALWHRKTIERQIDTNIRYNKQFTQSENQGYCLNRL